MKRSFHHRQLLLGRPEQAGSFRDALNGASLGSCCGSCTNAEVQGPVKKPSICISCGCDTRQLSVPSPARAVWAQLAHASGK